jgi:hypothetical protein
MKAKRCDDFVEHVCGHLAPLGEVRAKPIALRRCVCHAQTGWSQP